MKGLTVAERFWTKVDIQGRDDCWPWTAGRNQKGYGYFYLPGVAPVPAKAAHKRRFGRG